MDALAVSGLVASVRGKRCARYELVTRTEVRSRTEPDLAERRGIIAASQAFHRSRNEKGGPGLHAGRLGVRGRRRYTRVFMRKGIESSRAEIRSFACDGNRHVMLRVMFSRHAVPA